MNRYAPFVEGWDCDLTGDGIPVASAISIKNLLAFQSGARGLNSPQTQCPVAPEELANATYEMCTQAIVESGVFTETPMEYFEYNHLHLALAGAAAAGLSGKPLEQVASEALRALGMDSSEYTTSHEWLTSMYPWIPYHAELVDLGLTLRTSPDDLEAFHMGYISRTLPGIPVEEMYDEWHKDRWTNTTEFTSFYQSNGTLTGDTEIDTGSYALGHWIRCPETLVNPEGPTRKWDWCHENPDHHSAGFLGALALVDVTRKFMVQSIPHPGAIQGALAGLDHLSQPISLMVADVVKRLVETLIAPSERSQDVCFYLCLVQYGLDYDVDLSTWGLENTGFKGGPMEAYGTYRDELHEAVGCGACPEDFDPSEPWYSE